MLRAHLAGLALGLLADTELRPSLLRLRTDVSLGAGTEALHEVWSTLQEPALWPALTGGSEFH